MENTQPAGAGEGGEAIAVTQPVANDEAQPKTEQSQETSVDNTQSEVEKLRKALDRKNREIGKRTAMRHQAERERDEYRKKLEQYESKAPQASDVPQESQFANYGDYLKAVARYEARQELAQGQQKAKEQQLADQEKQWEAERDEHIRENAAKAREAIPGFDKFLADNQHYLESFPPHVVKAFKDSDEPVFAFHQMVNDGSIDELLQAPNERRAAALIAKAEIKASQPKPKTATKAPQPLSQTKGTAPSGKSLSDMSGDELMDWLKS